MAQTNLASSMEPARGLLDVWRGFVFNRLSGLNVEGHGPLFQRSLLHLNHKKHQTKVGGAVFENAEGLVWPVT
jgi:hypothetical protein